MKKLILLVGLFLTTLTLSKADEKSFNEAMISALTQFRSAAAPTDFSNVANQFERIARAEKNQWLPFYYAAYVSVIQTYVNSDKTKADQVLDYAEKMVNEALAIQGNESEIYVVQGFLYCARIQIDPNSRGAQYSQMALASFRKAQALNADNPRADYMLGMVLLNTPDFYGGGKKVAQPILEGAMNKYEKFVPLTALHPVWGKEECQKQLDACKQ